MAKQRAKKTTSSYRTWPSRKLAQKRCARNSHRIVSPNTTTRIMVCCPPGQWMPRKKRCKVGLRAHAEYKRLGFKKSR